MIVKLSQLELAGSQMPDPYYGGAGSRQWVAPAPIDPKFAPGDVFTEKNLEEVTFRAMEFAGPKTKRHLRWVYKGEVQIDGSLLPRLESLERLNAAWRELCLDMIPTSVYAGAEPNKIAKVIQLQLQHDRRFQ